MSPAGFRHAMPFGAEYRAGTSGATRFRLWAPSSERVDLLLPPAGRRLADIDQRQVPRHPLEALAHGWHELLIENLSPGARYAFEVTTRDGGRLAVPDPASRHNPDGVHGTSAIVDPLAYRWQHSEWRGRPWHEAVIYEVHVGAFTPEGTFAALEARLPDLAALGITALELMPLAAFAGRCNWGYDGVLPFAPASAYGSPDELKHLIDAAHGAGLMVLVDVVYNHFGPDGNYLHAYCPEFFNAAESTPWGEAIRLEGPSSRPVREFFLHNALYWIEEMRCDGLRLDAVHALRDRSTPDLVEEIAAALASGPGREREVHLVLENHRNQVRYLERDARGRPRCASAQWNDDVHHALHALLTGEHHGYYVDFSGRALAHLGRALAEGFAFQGEYSRYRRHARGEASAMLPPTAFVSFLQNHDMVGNRARGERIDALADPHRIEAAYVCLLLAPQIPLLFMGEEYGATTPFLYFCDFEAELARTVAAGRRRDLERFAAIGATPGAAPASSEPSPPDERAFAASRLEWSEREHAPRARRLALVRGLLALRRKHLPVLAGIRHAGRCRIEGGLLELEWSGDAGTWRLWANFGRAPHRLTAPPAGECVFRNDPSDRSDAAGEPRSAGSRPETSIPQASIPQASIPQASIPQASIPQERPGGLRRGESWTLAAGAAWVSISALSAPAP